MYMYAWHVMWDVYGTFLYGFSFCGWKNCTCIGKRRNQSWVKLLQLFGSSYICHTIYFMPLQLFFLLRTKFIVCKWVGSMKGNRFRHSVFYILKLIFKHLLTSQQYIRMKFMKHKLLQLVSKKGSVILSNC